MTLPATVVVPFHVGGRGVGGIETKRKHVPILTHAKFARSDDIVLFSKGVI